MSDRTVSEIKQIIRAARGEIQADMLIRNAQLVNVLSAEIHPADIAIYRGRIIGFGDYDAEQEIDVDGAFVAPGFIDGHVHIESSMAPPAEYSRAVMPRGVTAVVADPHEIANVFGLEGIRYMLKSAERTPLRCFFMLPSCVPASPFETPGAHLGATDLAAFAANPHILGLGEVMNFPGVLAGDDEVLEKLLIVPGKAIDGHAPGVTGKDLSAYSAAGIRSDHECTTVEEARDKLRQGLHIHIREASNARNLKALISLANEATAANISLATDDKTPADLLTEGGIDYCLRLAIESGASPITAYRMASISTARHYRLHDMGAIAPGYLADLVVLDNLAQVKPSTVIIGGKQVARDGETIMPRPKQNPRLRKSVSIDWAHLKDIHVKAEVSDGELMVERTAKVRLIELTEDQLITEEGEAELTVRSGVIEADPENDILKIIVVERHHHTGHVGIGFVRGFGLWGGALASSVAHDSHNIIAVGVSDDEILTAVREVNRMMGGLVVIENGQPAASLALPIAGLMSDRPIEEIAASGAALKEAARRLGAKPHEPFMALSFLALAVIPKLKLTDLGLVDVERFDFVPVTVD